MEFSALKVGSTLHYDTYIIKEVLGRGGFGITYLAYDTKLDKEVAIKEFFPEMLCNREGDTGHVTSASVSSSDMIFTLKEKFLKEARNIAKLNHPNIIKIYSAFEENNTAYYVMEYIQGISLDQRVKNHGVVPQQLATKYINEVGEALSYLHGKHMTHLDVKPANIILRISDDTPILIDFGLSKNYDKAGSATTTHGALGVSPGFSPSEQYLLSGAESFSPRSDLYSLAATFYFLLTGNVPAEAITNPAANLAFPANVSLNIRDAIVKAMSSSPAQRHESIRKFLSEVNDPSYRSQKTQPFYGNSNRPANGQPTVIHNASTQPDNAGNPTVISGVNNPYGGYPVKDDSKFKTKVIAAVVAFVVLCAAVVAIVFISKDDDKKMEASDDGLVAVLDTAVISPEQSATDSKPAEEITVATEEPAAEPAVEETPRSEYGPFDSRQDAIGFMEGFYSTIDNNGRCDSYLASSIETNFGTPKRFSRSEYGERMATHNSRHEVISTSRDYNWGSLKATPLANGGVKLKYNQIFYMQNIVKGEYRDRKFRLTTEVDINGDGQITKYKESTKTLEDW